MTPSPQDNPQREPGGWILLPFKAIAVAIVLPLRLAWEALRLLGRALGWVFNGLWQSA